MRCSNCGWDNNESRAKCEKCNSLLIRPAEMEKSPTYTVDSDLRKTSSQSLYENREDYSDKKTVSDINYTTCPECNYPLFPDNKTCPKCGRELDITARHDDRKTTVIKDYQTLEPSDLTDSIGCKLRMIKDDDENITSQTLTFSGKQIALNRANTEENNLSIASKEQALLSYENNKWYIQDRSEQKTTFVRTSGKVELKPGDIVMLGNRMFEFE